jgi:hypothetical protein
MKKVLPVMGICSVNNSSLKVPMEVSQVAVLFGILLEELGSLCCWSEGLQPQVFPTHRLDHTMVS